VSDAHPGDPLAAGAAGPELAELGKYIGGSHEIKLQHCHPFRKGCR
jgi:hypothetical protein